MNKYEKPTVEVIEVKTEDIITVSVNLIDIDGGEVNFIDSWLQES